MGVYVDERVDELDLERALEEVSPARRAYALRYRNEIDRKLSVSVYLLLKRGLQEEYGIKGNPVLALGPNGKPFLKTHPDIHFNFSHCPKAAVCAISSKPVGADIEAVAPVDWVVAERVLSRDELKVVRESSRPDVLFARYWTRKEALVKLRGEVLDETLLAGLLDGGSGGMIETHEVGECVVSIAGEEGPFVMPTPG